MSLIQRQLTIKCIMTITILQEKGLTTFVTKNNISTKCTKVGKLPANDIMKINTLYGCSDTPCRNRTLMLSNFATQADM